MSVNPLAPTEDLTLTEIGVVVDALDVWLDCREPDRPDGLQEFVYALKERLRETWNNAPRDLRHEALAAASEDPR